MKLTKEEIFYIHQALVQMEDTMIWDVDKQKSVQYFKLKGAKTRRKLIKFLKTKKTKGV